MFTDTHCHLYKEYYDNIETVLNEAKDNNVSRIIVSGASHKDNIEVIKLVNTYDEIYGTLSIHPEMASKYNEDDIRFIENNLINPKIIAIGEIGLDYYWVQNNKDEQKELFKIQLELAKKYNLPVVIHSRDATEDTINILKDYDLKGIIHAFSGSLETAKIYVKMGYLLGIGGVVTFKNSKLNEVVKSIGVENIVLETDAPYLTPHPFRGKQNSPKYIDIIADYICQLCDISKSQLSIITNDNIRRIFDI